MKLIIKQPIAKNEWSTIFCVGDNACEKAGTLSNIALEKMRSEGMILEMEHTKVIEDHFRHVPLMEDVKSHNYLEIKKLQEKPSPCPVKV